MVAKSTASFYRLEDAFVSADVFSVWSMIRMLTLLITLHSEDFSSSDDSFYCRVCPSFLYTLKCMSTVAIFYSFITLGQYLLLVHFSIQNRS